MTHDSRCAVIVDSIGTATPGQAVAVAQGLGLSIEATLRAIYRAPAVLASELTRALAENLSGLLARLGFEVRVSEQPAAPSAGPLLDVALHLNDPGRALDVAAVVGDFCGIDATAALRQLVEPPGIVLGSVTRASVNALEARLVGLDAELVVSDPLTAQFDLFAADLPERVRARLRSDLRDASQATFVGGGAIATGLPHDLAGRLWRSYGRTGQVKIVDQAFLRFDVLLDGLKPGCVRDPEQDAFLNERFGIPHDLVDDLLAAAPVTLANDFRHGAFENLLGDLDSHGLAAHADLATFRSTALHVASASDPALVQAELAGFGLAGCTAPPPLVTPPMPATLARIVRARLESAGAEVWIAEATQ